MDGVILKGVGGFYTVRTERGPVQCRARGKFRLQKITPLPGDHVDVDVLADGSGWLREIHARKNVFTRPPVCNLDALVLVISQAIPRSDAYLVDRMTVTAARQNIEAILCVNKTDLDAAEELIKTYTLAGFRVLPVSAETGEGVPQLANAIAGAVVAFTGNSGVGKSALLNRLDNTESHLTGEVSVRLGRGRHTTRHVELFQLPQGTLVADTPGFSALDAAHELPRAELAACFIDFLPYLGHCRFTGCLHEGVLGCAVAEAVDLGHIARSRYDSYKKLLGGAGR